MNSCGTGRHHRIFHCTYENGHHKWHRNLRICGRQTQYSSCGDHAGAFQRRIFFTRDGSANATRVYSYYLSFFEKHDEKYRSMRTEYIDCWQRSFTNTYEQIKSELLHRKPELPNPAVYAIETSLKFPLDETLLPVAKRSLVRYISTKAACKIIRDFEPIYSACVKDPSIYFN